MCENVSNFKINYKKMNKLKEFEEALKIRNKFLLFDLEANTEEDSKIADMRIIQIWYLVFDNTLSEIDSWSIFIKQEENAPKLTSFIKNLTGITEKQVDNWVYFKEWLEKFLEIYENCDYLLSYGHYDMKQLLSDCNNLEIYYPFNEWNWWKYSKHFNIKDIIAKKLNIRAKGMESLLKYLNLELEWRHHNWEDDSKNVFKIIKKVFKENSDYHLFLDIDGILNKFNSNNDLDDDLVNNLKYLLEEIKFKIILTSDRRFDWEEFKNLWINAWLEMFHDTTEINCDNLSSDNNKLSEIRTREIKNYIKKHNIKNYYIILDDLDLNFEKNFYKINPYKGLEKSIVNLIIKNHQI